MKTSNYIKELGYGVLHNTHMSSINLVNESSVAPLLTLIDEGLSRLYTRFNLSEKSLILEMRVGVTMYHLKKIYSVQGNDPVRVPYPYIMDLPNEPFLEDVIKVIRVVDGNNKERPLNDPNVGDSIFTPEVDILQFKYPKAGEVYFVTYLARHAPLLSFTNTGFTIRDEIHLPAVLVPALSNYVAYMVHSRINTPESQARGAQSLMIYEEICKEVERSDAVANSVSGINTRFKQNGWK